MGYDLKTGRPKSAGPEKNALQRTKSAREMLCWSLGGSEKPTIPGPFDGARSHGEHFVKLKLVKGPGFELPTLAFVLCELRHADLEVERR